MQAEPIEISEPELDRRDAWETYRQAAPGILTTLEAVRRQIDGVLASLGVRYTLKARAKSFESLFEKAVREGLPTSNGLPVSADLLGLRVICPFLEDLRVVETSLGPVIHVVERESKGAAHDALDFAYQSVHLTARVPESAVAEPLRSLIHHFELQLRTSLQEAWSEVEHELVYKVDPTMRDPRTRRKLAGLKAALDLADTSFQEIRDYQREVSTARLKRRGLFFESVNRMSHGVVAEHEALTVNGALPADNGEPARVLAADPSSSEAETLLVRALGSHVDCDYLQAIELYTRVLSLGPADGPRTIATLHRGLAHFCLGDYLEAIADLDAVIRGDQDNAKALFYRAMAHHGLQRTVPALADVERVLVLTPSDPHSLCLRAELALCNGDVERARADCQRALHLDDSFHPATVLMERMQRPR